MQTLTQERINKVLSIKHQSASAWVVIIGFIVATALLALIGAGKVLNIAFPAGAFAVGFFLYLRFPVLYAGFTWWLLFLTPFVRRYADYRNSFTDPSPILLAPYLVILIVLPTFLKKLPKIYQQRSLGLFFILPCIAILYAACIAKVQNFSSTQIVIASLDWLTPVLFGFYLFINWDLYPNYRQNLQRTFLWGVLVTGIYGIYQYVVAPEWDRLWRIETNFTSVGLPEPFQFNIFSTMNSNGPFATAMMTGLLLLLVNKTSLRIPVAGVGLLAILLANVRTLWGALVLGILIYANSLKLKSQVYLLVTLLLIGAIAIPVVNMEPFEAKVSNRVETFSNIEDDVSGRERTRMYQLYGYKALTSLVGNGIASQGYDSGIINMLLQLGWIGTTLYLAGLVQLLAHLLQNSKNANDPFLGIIRSIILPMLLTLFMGSALIELSGIILWGLLGMGMASSKYHQHINRLRGLQAR